MAIAATLGCVTERLELETVVEDERATMFLRGELDLRSRDDFRIEVLRAVEGGARSILVDASAVPFVDSSGLGTLVGTRRRLTDAGIGFELEPSSRLRDLLRRTGLLDWFAPSSS